MEEEGQGDPRWRRDMMMTMNDEINFFQAISFDYLSIIIVCTHLEIQVNIPWTNILHIRNSYLVSDKYSYLMIILYLRNYMVSSIPI